MSSQCADSAHAAEGIQPKKTRQRVSRFIERSAQAPKAQTSAFSLFSGWSAAPTSGPNIYAIQHLDAQHIAVGYADGSIKTFDMSSGSFVETWQFQPFHRGAVTALTVAPPSIFSQNPVLISGGRDGVVVTWNTADGTALEHVDCHGGAICDISYDASGMPRRLAVATQADDRCSGMMAGTAQIIKMQGLYKQEYMLSGEDDGGANAASFSPQGTVVATTDVEDNIILYDPQTGKTTDTLSDAAASTLSWADENTLYAGAAVSGEGITSTLGAYRRASATDKFALTPFNTIVPIMVARTLRQRRLCTTVGYVDQNKSTIALWDVNGNCKKTVPVSGFVGGAFSCSPDEMSAVIAVGQQTLQAISLQCD